MEDEAYGTEAWNKLQQIFSGINKGETVYLDHAGTTFYSPSNLQAVFGELSNNLYGNPHSRSASSKLTSDLIDQIRAQVLRFFNASSQEYDIIFTSGTTGSLKLVAESFAFSSSIANHGPNNSGSFVYMKESHTSVVGMRECIKTSNVPCFALPLDEIDQYLKNTVQIKNAECDIDATKDCSHNSLFVFPAQCNFSGSKYPLEWIAAAQNKCLSKLLLREFCINGDQLKKADEEIEENWYCLLDAASFVGTNQLDLNIWKPDFVALSFYKILGYPTGLGALLVHKRAQHTLKKKYFGGGTVEMFSSSRDIHVQRQSLHERFEDGTVNFLAILSLRNGLEELEKFVHSMDIVSTHTFHLGQLLYNSLRELNYDNGQNLVELYCSSQFTDRRRQGGIVTFNVKNENGDHIGYAQVEKILALYDIQVRTGCFCNPASCQRYLGLSEDDLAQQFMSGHKCGDEMDLVNGKPTGAIRASIGYMTRKSDIIRLVEVIKDCFLKEKSYIQHLVPTMNNGVAATEHMKLVSIHVYPVKSCGAFNPKTDWPISKSGLLYDRKWVIVNAVGAALTQKREPRLCLIIPEIDLEEGLLHLRHRETETSVSIPLEPEAENLPKTNVPSCFTKICGSMVEMVECGSVVNEWLEEVLHQSGVKLLKYSESADKLSLANDAPFLLVNRNSAINIQQQFSSPDAESLENCLSRFRGNLVIDGVPAFEEEKWEIIKCGPFIFKNVGFCYRCQMICVDQETAIRNREPLTVLATTRGKKIPFGVLLELSNLDHKNKAEFLQIGCSIIPTCKQ